MIGDGVGQAGGSRNGTLLKPPQGFFLGAEDCQGVGQARSEALEGPAHSEYIVPGCHDGHLPRAKSVGGELHLAGGPGDMGCGELELGGFTEVHQAQKARNPFQRGEGNRKGGLDILVGQGSEQPQEGNPAGRIDLLLKRHNAFGPEKAALSS